MKSSRKIIMSDDELETNFVSGKENDLEELLSKLDFISNLKEDEVIYVNSLSKSEYGWGTSFYRSILNFGGLWTTESKKATLNFFKETIDAAFRTVSVYIKKNNPYPQSVVKMILTGISESKKGIVNYQGTCQKQGDDIFVSQINSFLKILDVKLQNVNQKIKRRKDKMDAIDKPLFE